MNVEQAIYMLRNAREHILNIDAVWAAHESGETDSKGRRIVPKYILEASAELFRIENNLRNEYDRNFKP